MRGKVVAACTFVLLSAFGSAQSQQSVSAPGSVCWPLHFSGIVLGTTTDSQVKRLLGRGVFRRDEGDTGGRYFINSKHTATLHVLSYTDYVVGEVSLRVGIDPAIKPDERKLAETKWFDPDEGFGNWHALRLGSSKEDVLKNLGRPKEEISSKEWRYDTVCACEIPEYFTIFFDAGHVASVVFSAPPG